MSPRDLGALLHYSMRYAMGRMTYAVDDVTRLMREHWHVIDQNGREQIAEDLRREIERDKLGPEYVAKHWRDLHDGMQVTTEPKP
jgi:hypothetical protein